MGIRLQAPCSPAGHPLSLPPMLTRNVYRRLCTGSDASKYPNPLCTYMYVGTGGGAIKYAEFILDTVYAPSDIGNFNFTKL